MKSTKLSQVERKWYLFDAKDKTLGRLSSEISVLLLGKNKPYFVRNLDCGDYVVVINASLVKVTGKKELNKKYTNYSGYPGGLRVRNLAYLRENSPEEIIKHAVTGMLPRNKLANCWLKKLFIFSGNEHPYSEKFINKDKK